MRAAVSAVRHDGPGRLVVAVPVAAPETSREIERDVNELVCVSTPADFSAVGVWYDDFSQTTDADVRGLMAGESEQGDRDGTV